MSAWMTSRLMPSFSMKYSFMREDCSSYLGRSDILSTGQGDQQSEQDSTGKMISGGRKIKDIESPDPRMDCWIDDAGDW